MNETQTKRRKLFFLPITAMASAFAVIIAFFPVLGEFFEYNRELVLAGEWWRLATSHWTHWTMEHLVWDLLMFAILLSHALVINWRRTVALLFATGFLIPAAIFLCHPQMSYYRGLSGLDSALFVYVAMNLIERSRASRVCRARGILCALLFLFGAKIIFEGVTGSAFFVRSMGENVNAVPLAHFLGGVAGCLAFFRLNAVWRFVRSGLSGMLATGRGYFRTMRGSAQKAQSKL